MDDVQMVDRLSVAVGGTPKGRVKHLGDPYFENSLFEAGVGKGQDMRKSKQGSLSGANGSWRTH